MTESDRDAFYRNTAQRLPVGRVGEADDLAHAYVYLMRKRESTCQYQSHHQRWAAIHRLVCSIATIGSTDQAGDRNGVHASLQQRVAQIDL